MDKATFEAIESSPMAVSFNDGMRDLMMDLELSMNIDGKKERISFLANKFREKEPDLLVAVAVLERVINDIPSWAQEIALMISGALIKARDEKLYDKLFVSTNTQKGVN